jgi:hypothetical protein
VSNIFADGPSPIRLALGTGKYAKQQFAAAAYQQVVDALKSLPTDLAIKYQKRAIRKAAKPGEDALRAEVGKIRSVTGNLAASVTTQIREYTNNRQSIPVVVAVVGFRRPVNQRSQRGATPAFEGGSVLKGPNRAYHSHLVEVGTRPRTPGVRTRQRRRGRVILGGRIRTRFENIRQQSGNATGILSSFKTRGAFTSGYPKDFIATGTVRGSKPLRPLAKAFASSQPAMKSVLDTELRKALRAAARVYQKRTGEIL